MMRWVQKVKFYILDIAILYFQSSGLTQIATSSPQKWWRFKFFYIRIGFNKIWAYHILNHRTFLISWFVCDYVWVLWLFTPFISTLFVILRKDLLLLNLITRQMTSASEQFLKNKGVLDLLCKVNFWCIWFAHSTV